MSTYSNAILADNPLAYYRMNDASGSTTCADSSGHDYTGTYIDIPEITYNKPGAVNDGDTAVQFSPATPQSTKCGVNTSLTMLGYAGQLSVEAWVQIVSLPAGKAVIVGNAAENDASGFTFWIDQNNALNVQYTTAGSNSFDGIFGSSAVPLPSSQYVHVVFTYDADTARLYVNGALRASVPSITGAGGMEFNGQQFCIGTRYVHDSNDINGVADQDSFVGVIDEVAFYSYALTGSQVNAHYLIGMGLSPNTPTYDIAGNDRHYFLIQVWDKTGSYLLDLPQADIDSIDLQDSLNGGSGQGTLVFRRGFNSIGQVAYLNRVLVWIWHGEIARPTNPYWTGYMVDIDQEQTVTTGKITVHLEGDAKQLDRGIVSENINPLVAGNPNLDAADYIRHLLDTYAPPGFAAYQVPAGMFPLLPLQFTQQKLGSVIDTVIKTGRDNVGQIWTWRVSSDYQCRRTFLVQGDQNPNKLNGPTFAYVFKDGMCAKYSISTKYRDIVNVVLVQGAQDPNTGQTVSAVYEDGASVSSYDPWEDAISVPALVNSDACYAYGEAYLDIHANPQAQGQIELWKPDPSIISGRWVQAWETASIIKQVRVGSVQVSIKPTRIIQTLDLTAPTPYLDEAVYKLGMNVQGAISSMTKNLSRNTQQNYVRLGGTISQGP